MIVNFKPSLEMKERQRRKQRLKQDLSVKHKEKKIDVNVKKMKKNAERNAIELKELKKRRNWHKHLPLFQLTWISVILKIKRRPHLLLKRKEVDMQVNHSHHLLAKLADAVVAIVAAEALLSDVVVDVASVLVSVAAVVDHHQV